MKKPKAGQTGTYAVRDALTGVESKLTVQVDFLTPGFVHISGPNSFRAQVPVGSPRLTF